MEFTDETISHLSDSTLLGLCQKYGSQALLWRQKFIGLLPEVKRRELYKKKGCSSIFEFAKKLAGISEEQVRLVLSLGKRFQDKPILKNMLEKGKVSVHKLARIVSIASKENEEMLANQVRLLPQKALETLVRDEKVALQNGNGNAFDKPNFKDKGLRAQIKTPSKIDNVKFDGKKINEGSPQDTDLYLSDEVKQKLLELQNKGIDVNELILEFLGKRQQEIAQEKERLAGEEKQKLEHLQEIWKEENVKTSRHIPVKIKKIIQKEHGKKCSVPTCKKLATEIHHSNRFSLSKIHDPRYMSPFCHEHHQIAHAIDIKVQQKKLPSAISG